MNNTRTLKKNTIRVFFAIKPEIVALERLANLAQHLATTCGGKYVKKLNIHLTLAFLGEISINQLAKLRHGINNVKTQTFYLSINKIGYWKHNQIIYAGINHCPPELNSLINNLQNSLSANDVTFDSRTFKPHITLVRKTKPGQIQPNLTPPIKWRVTEWLLLQSKQTVHGVSYIPLDRWPLSRFSSQTLPV